MVAIRVICKVFVWIMAIVSIIVLTTFGLALTTMLVVGDVALTLLEGVLVFVIHLNDSQKYLVHRVMNDEVV